MANIPLYKIDGVKGTSVALANNVLIKPKPSEIKTTVQVIKILLDNQTHSHAWTKTQGEVKASKKKPWRQKGTGRARVGSVASPIWRGGGIVFGPRRFKTIAKKINQKTKNLAWKVVLSDLVKENRLIIVNNFSLPKIKTKEVVNFLNKLPYESGTFLIVLDKREPNFELSAANLPYLKCVLLPGLKLLDLLKYEYIVFSKQALKDFEAKIAPQAAKTKDKRSEK